MNIYVGNLPLETTEGELRRAFTEFGEVKSVTVMDDKYIGSGRPNGYAYVEMPSKTEGANAITGLEGKTLRGREISVVEALPLSNRNGAELPKISNRSNKKRERQYQKN
jgi:RNA recognition motif-containing protein